MNCISQKIIRALHHSRMRIPVVSNYASSKFISNRYANELALMRGKVGRVSQKNSIAFFTIHKAASVFAGSVLRRMAKLSGYKCIHYEACSFAGGELPYRYDLLGDWSEKIYPPKGYFFGPFREYHNALPWLHNGSIILHLRDPRDVLVSLYYSLRYSHSIPNANKNVALNMRSTREAISLIDINEFVLEEAPRIKKVYSNYLEGFANLNSLWISKYEEMIGDFTGWLVKACRFLEVENPAKMVEILKGMQSVEVSENKNNHKRQVTPGDHLRKLNSDTICKLDMALKDVLIKTGYSLNNSK